MSFIIPQIVYGVENTVIAFEYPPEVGGDGPDELTTKDNTVFSLSGVRQTSFNYIDANRFMVFSFASEALLLAFQNFITGWACLGNSFQYYDDATSEDFVTYELVPGYKFKPVRITGVSGSPGDYIYKIPLQFRRTVGEASTDMITSTLNNNQVAAANVPGIVFDYTMYSSVKIFLELNRKSSAVERVANGYITAIYKQSTTAWDVTPGGTFDGDDMGVAFSMNGEQLAYTSDNQAGTGYVGVFKIKEMIFQ